jgi:lipoprotein-releasing system ATP-binding protein
MSSTAKIVLVAQGIAKSYSKGGREVPVIRGVDLKISEGETVAIMGSSGAGKSTLLHVLGTLEPPTRGKVLFGPEGKDLFSLSERELSHFRNRSLGFVFQFHYLLPEFTALENVMMPALIAGYDRGQAMTQARELLGFVGLDQRLEHRPSELSGGEQQRVAVARSVILRPKLLMADELTGNLDSTNSDVVIELLAELNRATGVAILLVTHDQRVASRMQRILTMRDGVLV